MNTEKIAIVILHELASWQKLNVTSFLASSVAIAFPSTHGANFTDAQGNHYLPFIKYPVLVYKADTQAQIKRAFGRAKDRELHIGIYVQELFATKNEEQNLVVISQYQPEDLNLVGIIVYGDSKKVDKALDGLKLHE
ncbi:MAG TPA: DUF2000 domain-containing protein [Pedobacter sp.]|jgi:hypothetical protein